jgi:hypothetical protein
VQARLLFLYSFFEKVLATEDKNIIDAFLPEFISEYVFCLKNYFILGLKPRIHELLIQQAEKIEKDGFASGYKGYIETIQRLKDELEKLEKILKGGCTETNESKGYFPLLEEVAIKETGIITGILESVTVKIHPAKKENKFIIVPSEKEIEEKINEQVNLSWMNAIRIAKKYVRKIHPYHEVIISFDKKAGFCKGNSLGTALTLAFIEEILATYNSPVAIKVGDGIAFTGGMDGQGRITNTSEEIIKQKTELIFFSDISHIAVPKAEAAAAIERLNELRQEYPMRDLKITGIEDLNDLLNRRNLIEIKKQPVIVRSGKFIKKNWVSAGVAVLLTIILSFLFVLDFDNNPAILSYDGDQLFIKNGNGKKLWALEYTTGLEIKTDPSLLKYCAKIVDIDEDGVNEVLLVNTSSDEKNESAYKGTLTCYDINKNRKWEYTFRDTVYSERENLQPKYTLYLIDTTLYGNIKTVLCFANNLTSFSSAIFALELETGKRLNQTQWNSGYTWDALVTDIDKNGEKEIVAIGADNGFNDGVIWGIELKNMNGYRPTTPEYRLKNFEKVDLIFYIRIPKTDYDIFNGGRVNGLLQGSLAYNENVREFRFTSLSSMDNTQKVNFPARYYNLNVHTMEFEVYIIDKFSSLRDSLVTQGRLFPPFTDTKEYREILKNQISYWLVPAKQGFDGKDGKWVKREELK